MILIVLIDFVTSSVVYSVNPDDVDSLTSNDVEYLLLVPVCHYESFSASRILSIN